MFFVYIIKSVSSDIFYVGHTDDPVRRLFEHNNLPVQSFTSKHRPWLLVKAFEVSENRADAMKIEKKIKDKKSSTYIQNLLKYPEMFAKLLVRALDC